MEKNKVSISGKAIFHLGIFSFTLILFGSFMVMESVYAVDYSANMEIIEHTPQCFQDCYTIFRIYDLPNDIEITKDEKMSLWYTKDKDAKDLKKLEFYMLEVSQDFHKEAILGNCQDEYDQEANNYYLGEQCEAIDYKNIPYDKYEWVKFKPKNFIFRQNTEYIIKAVAKKNVKAGYNNVDWKISFNGYEPDWAWFNSTWFNRIPINITSDDLTNDRDFDILDLNITELSLFTNNCSRELRFTDSNDIEIPFAIIDDSGQSIGDGSEWCKVRIIGEENWNANTSKIYHVYFNNTLPPTPSYYGLQIFGSNFSSYNGSQWSESTLGGGSCVFSSADNMRIINRTSGAGACFYSSLWVGNNTPYSEFSFNIDMRKHDTDGDSSRMGVINYGSGVIGSNFLGDEFTIFTQSDSDNFWVNESNLVNTTSIVRTAYQWYNLKMIYDNGDINGFVDGTQSLYYFDDDFPYGKAGMKGYIGGTFNGGIDSQQLDNFCIVTDSDYECKVYDTTMIYEQLTEETFATTTTTTTSTTTTISIQIEKFESKFCRSNNLLVTNITEWNGTDYLSEYNSTVCEYNCSESWLGTRCNYPTSINNGIWVMILTVILFGFFIIYGLIKKVFN